MNYRPTIGLEVHVQLKTKSKLFCGCSTKFGVPPNTNICPVCTGQPGVLPVLNKKVVELAVKASSALNCEINRVSIFARKNYFYPDLPKNYQISQFEQPLAVNGYLNTGEKKVSITRIHLEEDAGKLIHAIGSRKLDYSLVDFNRTGIPLLEIVTEPEINSPEETYLYLTTLKSILQYLEVSDCDMEKGFLRCDANVSVSKKNSLGTKIELKNMNSFKAVRDALTFEIKRQVKILNSGKKVVQETRLWDTDQNITLSMRTKEESHDYRYFPEPDLAPLELSDEFINDIKKTIQELPEQKKQRFIDEYGLSEYDAKVLVSEKSLSEYFEQVLNQMKTAGFRVRDVTKLVTNWITTELLGKLNAIDKSINESPVSAGDLAELVGFIKKGTVSGKIAKDIFDEMFSTGKKSEQIIKEKNLVQITDEKTITKLVEEVLQENPEVVQEYQSGKKKALGALVGAVMKKTQGKSNPQIVNKILKDKISIN